MKLPESRATVIDPFVSYWGVSDSLTKFKENLRDYLDRITIIKGYSQNELGKLEPDSFDIIYIDGDHASEVVLTDAILSFSLLKAGGLMIFDDYLMILQDGKPNRTVNDFDHPFTGINIFLERYKDLYELIVSNYQVIIKKN